MTVRLCMNVFTGAVLPFCFLGGCNVKPPLAMYGERESGEGSGGVPEEGSEGVPEGRERRVSEMGRVGLREERKAERIVRTVFGRGINEKGRRRTKRVRPIPSGQVLAATPLQEVLHEIKDKRDRSKDFSNEIAYFYLLLAHPELDLTAISPSLAVPFPLATETNIGVSMYGNLPDCVRAILDRHGDHLDAFYTNMRRSSDSNLWEEITANRGDYAVHNEKHRDQPTRYCPMDVLEVLFSHQASQRWITAYLLANPEELDKIFPLLQWYTSSEEGDTREVEERVETYRKRLHAAIFPLPQHVTSDFETKLEAYKANCCPLCCLSSDLIARCSNAQCSYSVCFDCFERYKWGISQDDFAAEERKKEQILNTFLREGGEFKKHCPHCNSRRSPDGGMLVLVDP